MDYINHIYAINLDKDTDRWNNVLSQLKSVDNSYTSKLIRISAIYGKNLNPTELESNTTTWCRYTCPPSAIGCYLSHIKAWETMIKNNDDVALIFEDDIVLSNNFNETLQATLNELNQKVPDWGFLYLGCSVGCNKNLDYDLADWPMIGIARLLQFTNNNNLSYNTPDLQYSYKPEFPLSAHAYIITRDTAEKFLKRWKKASGHIDFMLNTQLFHSDKINVFACNQNIALQNRESYLSNQSNQFPITVNKLFTYFEKPSDDNETFAYKLSFPLFYISPINQNIDGYLIIWILLLLFFPIQWTFQLILFSLVFGIIEFLLNPQNINRIILFIALVPFILIIKGFYRF